MVQVKRLIAMLLVLTLVLGCLPMAAAAEGSTEEVHSSCDHNWMPASHEICTGGTNNGCIILVTSFEECTKCHSTRNSRKSTKIISHTGTPQSSGCDGNWQTLSYICSYCGTSYTRTVRCPASGHAPGACPALPFSLRPEVL